MCDTVTTILSRGKTSGHLVFSTARRSISRSWSFVGQRSGRSGVCVHSRRALITGSRTCFACRQRREQLIWSGRRGVKCWPHPGHTRGSNSSFGFDFRPAPGRWPPCAVPFGSSNSSYGQPCLMRQRRVRRERPSACAFLARRITMSVLTAPASAVRWRSEAHCRRWRAREGPLEK